MQLYDRHGVWPPNANMPSPEAGPSFTRTSRNMRRDGHSRPSPQPGPFSDPFFSDPFFQQGFPGPSFAFRDPFEIFSSVFGDMHVRSGFNDSGSFMDVHFPFGSSPFGSSPFGSSPFGSSPFGASPFGGAPFGSSMNSMMGGGPNVRTHSSVSQFISAGSRSESQSVITRTVNGRTETITKKRDANVSLIIPHVSATHNIKRCYRETNMWSTSLPKASVMSLTASSSLSSHLVPSLRRLGLQLSLRPLPRSLVSLCRLGLPNLHNQLYQVNLQMLLSYPGEALITVSHRRLAHLYKLTMMCLTCIIQAAPGASTAPVAVTRMTPELLIPIAATATDTTVLRTADNDTRVTDILRRSIITNHR